MYYKHNGKWTGCLNHNLSYSFIIYPLHHNKILDLTNLKAWAIYEIPVDTAKNLKLAFGKVEKIVGNG